MTHVRRYARHTRMGYFHPLNAEPLYGEAETSIELITNCLTKRIWK